MLLLLNELFQLDISEGQLLKYALELGSDCPFFINPRPVYARGRGELMHDIPLNLDGFHLIVVKPPVHVSTAWAYQQLVPAESRIALKALVHFGVDRWQGNIQNHFERIVFAAHPEVGEIKKTLYKLGAAFALMSGSGSAVYGLFRSEKRAIESHFPPGYQIFKQKL
jgi:4-diphosphocytidyl-2-C-methyl-D-erythritol kinase